MPVDREKSLHEDQQVAGMEAEPFDEPPVAILYGAIFSSASFKFSPPLEDRVRQVAAAFPAISLNSRAIVVAADFRFSSPLR
jgi:hypothetical protein